jgi:2-polyprenyl-3-methyl-5-hydroxy-6-metoxy-1,4-benzoquinol methylase
MRGLRYYLGLLWEETWELNRQLMISLLGPGIDTLLDCGCDDGEFTERVARSVMARKVLVIEIDKDRASKAAERGIEVISGDLNRKFKLDDSIADAVIANQVIEHLYDTDNFISEIWRVLKPGGVLVLSTENLASWHNVFALLLGWQPFSLTNISESSMGIGNPLALHRGGKGVPKTFQHLRAFTPRSLTDLLQNQGFDIDHSYGIGYFPFKGKTARVLSRLTPSHSALITIKARKPQARHP